MGGAAKATRGGGGSPKHSLVQAAAHLLLIVFVSAVFSGLAQIVSHTSTPLVAKARAMDARDQDVDRDLDIVPRRHTGGPHSLNTLPPRPIDQRADRGTG